jgi:AcrR family transcriptional regulator
MMLAGEQLFAERGFRGVSLREIGLAAGQRNNSAAQYHFGSRLGLAEAIFEHRMETINERRVARLDRLDADGRQGDLQGFVEALVVPLAEAIGSPSAPSYYARFASQLAFDPEFDVIVELDRPFLSGLRRVIEGMLLCLGDLPLSVAQTRIHLTLRLVTVALADQERLATSPDGAPWRRVSVTDLVDAGMALLTGPRSGAPGDPPRASPGDTVHDPDGDPDGDPGGDPGGDSEHDRERKRRKVP